MKEMLTRNKIGKQRRRCRSVLVLLLVFSMMVTVFQENTVMEVGATDKEIFHGNGFEVSFSVEDIWDGGYKATVALKNTGEEKIENWCLCFPLAGEITDIWNAVIESSIDGEYSIKNVGWNQDISVNSTISFGFVVKGDFKSYPLEYALQTSLCIIDQQSYKVEYTVLSDWSDGFCGSMEITNLSDSVIEDWKLSFSFDNKISQIWNAVILQESDGKYIIDNDGNYSNIQSQQSVTFGFLCEKGDGTILPEQFELQEYTTDKGKTGVNNSDSDEYEEDDETEELSEENASRYVHIELSSGNTEKCVIDDIVLVNDAAGRYDVEWVSSNEEVISNTGKVFRPEKNQTVVMTAIVKGDAKSVKVPFALDVRGKSHINTSEMEDFSLEDLKELNSDDEDYEVIVNDFGFLQEVYGKYSDIKVDSYESALYSLYSVKSAIGISDPFTELIPYKTFVDDTGYTFQFIQTIQGITTFDNTITVSANKEGETDYLKSGYYPVEKNISTVPHISYKEAEDILSEQYGAVKVQEKNKNKLCIVNYYGNVDLVWDIRGQVVSNQDSFSSGSYQFLVGAADGEVKYRSKLENDATTVKRVKASGEDLEGIQQTFFVQKNTEKNIFTSKTTYTLQDPFFNITIAEGEGHYEGDFVLDEERNVTKSKNQWKPVEVSAMHNLKKILAFYRSDFDRVSYADNNHDEKKYIYRRNRYS